MADEEIVDVAESEAHQPTINPPHGLLTFHMEPSEKTAKMEQGKAVRFRGQVYVIQWRRERGKGEVSHPIVEFGLLLK